MRYGLARVTRVALVTLGVALAANCYINTLDGVPKYPGASIGPGYRQRDGDRTALKQIYYTSDSYFQVVEFYGRAIGKEDGWESVVGGDLAVWRKNMQLDPMGTAASPLDPARVGKLIVIVNEGSRTTIRAFSSHPGV